MSHTWPRAPTSAPLHHGLLTRNLLARVFAGPAGRNKHCAQATGTLPPACTLT